MFGIRQTTFEYLGTAKELLLGFLVAAVALSVCFRMRERRVTAGSER